MDKGNLTHEALKNALHYDPDTGVFTWRLRFGKRGIPGRRAGTIDFNGYEVITINGKRHKAHRLAWLYVHGRWPAVAIDHINGVRSENRIQNLREAGPAENQQNRGRQRNNKSGFTGVSWDQSAGKWRAGIRADGRARNLGGYDSPEQASEAYLAAKAAVHKFNPVPRDA